MSDDAAHDGAPLEQKRVWDPVVRLTHWLLVICVTTSLLLGHFGPNIMTLHFWSGYAVCALVSLRLIWGLIGTEPARFLSFLPGPKTVLRYLNTVGRRSPSHWPGHNPLGALSVFAILGVLVAQVVTGLLADPEDYVNVGPMAHLVSSGTNQAASAWHERLSFVLLGLIALHVGAVLYYLFWKKENLIAPMVHGWKWVRRR